MGARDLVFHHGPADDRTLQGPIWQTAGNLGGKDTSQGEITPPPADDPTPFDVAAVDTVHITGGDYPFAATTLDRLEQVSAATLERVGRTLETWLEGGEQ